MALHQCEIFINKPSLIHEHAMRHIKIYLGRMYTYMDLLDGNYLLFTHGVTYKLFKEKGIECYINADFFGEWAQVNDDNAKNIISCTGYVSMFSGWPVLWCSKLQMYI